MHHWLAQYRPTSTLPAASSPATTPWQSMGGGITDLIGSIGGGLDSVFGMFGGGE
jgi:hypothetical protein